MRAVDLIRRKRDGGVLGADDIRSFVDGVTDGTWPDYQVASMLMAIVLRGMTMDEAAALTGAMVASGERLDWTSLAPRPADKHSTGGVGDKVSLALAPLAAACGVVVPMMSGRGLGHTGGTLDKLDTIPGFRSRLATAEMARVLESTGCALVGQTDAIAPADRRLYAMRDVTATVESLPLICASILSKKIAEGARALVLDVKVGSGAFMKTAADAHRLALWLVSIGSRHGLAVEAHLTPMDAPLGRTVGNAIEVVEAVETLKGRGPADLEALTLHLTAAMVRLAGVERSDDDARRRVRGALSSGEGFRRFQAIVEAQGGDPRALDDYARLPHAAHDHVVTAPRQGVVAGLDAYAIGCAAVALGAGRDRVDDVIHPGAGIEILAGIGDAVRSGDPVLRLLFDDPSRLASAEPLARQAIRIAEAAPPPPATVLDTVTAAGASV
jgi:pyrimidine-nucleoside phosphorylase